MAKSDIDIIHVTLITNTQPCNKNQRELLNRIMLNVTLNNNNKIKYLQINEVLYLLTRMLVISVRV